MAIPWGALKSLVIFFGPMLLPKALAHYRKLRAEVAHRAQQPASNSGAQTRPLSTRSVMVLTLLALVALGHFLSAGLVPGLPLGTALLPPENIFAATESRLQAPTDVLFTRLAARRANGTLTPADRALRARLASLDTRLLYLQYGPAVIADCPFCGGTGVDAGSGFSAAAFGYYALVDLLAVHVFNLVVVAVATSPLLFLGGRSSSDSDDSYYNLAAAQCGRWRTPASVAALAVAALDIYLVVGYDRAQNARATRLADVEFFYWTMRTYRGVASGLLLTSLAVILYWAATGLYRSPRLGLVGVLLFGAATDPAESATHRVAAVTRALAGVKSKVSAGAIVKNTAQRDADLRARTQAYWAREVLLVNEAMQDREVVEGINDALQNRIDIQRIERDAETYAQVVVPSIGPESGAAAEEKQSQQPPITVVPSTPEEDASSVTKRK